MTEAAKNAIEGLAVENGAGIDSTVKKVRLKTSTTEKMQRFYPLFADDLANMPKESDMIAFMIEKAFEVFVDSGVIEKRLSEIAKGG